MCGCLPKDRRSEEGSRCFLDNMGEHVAVRTCIGCRTRKPQRDLLRFTRSPNGDLLIGGTSAGVGRGGYLCYNWQCLKKALVKGEFRRRLGRDPDTGEIRLVEERLRNGFGSERTW